MKIDTALGGDLLAAGPAAKAAEDLGFDGLFTAETGHDPFFPILQAANTTERVELMTAIAVAFARNPMTLAQIGNDLQAASRGRFILGLGSQIKPHIERRYSMPWSKPAARMREMVMAIRAIWDCWNEGTKLDFEGEFYTHTLMTPFFSPGPNPHGTARIVLAAVGELMCETAGETCDGILCHGFTTEAYLREVTLPAIERGRARADAQRDFEVILPGFVVTGDTEEEMTKAADAVRGQIAFYGSTPAYRGVLERHGWGDLQPELKAMTKEGRWKEMGALIDDDMLGTFAVVGAPDEIPKMVRDRFGDVVDRFSFYAPYSMPLDRWATIGNAIRTA